MDDIPMPSDFYSDMYIEPRAKMQYNDFIHMHSDGTVLLGSTDYTGRVWDGNISIFKPSGELLEPDVDDEYTIKLESSSAASCFIGDSNKVLLCEDNGAVSIWKKEVDWAMVIKYREHDSNIMAVDCVEDKKSYVTVEEKGHMKIWDVRNDLCCMTNYISAHTKIIFDVSVRPNSIKNIATGSMDRNIYLWDNNVDRPASELFESDSSVRCLKWIDEQTLLFGNEGGYLCSIDVRQPGKHIPLMNMIAPLHKIIVKPESHLVAVCCDNKTVTVFNMSSDNPQVIYKNNNFHGAFVRGLAWDAKEEGVLHTVGWDDGIKTHYYL